MLSYFTDSKRLDAARGLLEHLASHLDARFYVRLWDGSMVALGSRADPNYFISIVGPGVLGSLMRRPTLETLLGHFASGRIDFHGGDMMEFLDFVRQRNSNGKLRGLSKTLLLRRALPLLFATGEKNKIDHQYDDDETGRRQSRRDNKKFIQFHYDLSNAFYRLFLDPEMQYSCAYFTDWSNSLEQAQSDKLEMICRKLRLAPGEKFLDIGCGWGGLIRHAAIHHGALAHGVTLSQKQYDYANEKIRSLGLSDRVTIELRDYTTLSGKYDKIASIGMYEHVGIANYPAYFKKIRSLLRDRGIFLNHGITRRAKHSRRRFQKISPVRRLILKYIFPGSELDHVGHTVESMEAAGFEVHDVEGWREHYARTSRFWCQRLSARAKEAIEEVGLERYRMWLAYLAGVSSAFADGSLRIFQVVASKHRAKGLSGLPPTSRDLYEG
jgi:cyclopropane-fatty-acyl-phospholipid synthase